MFRQSFRNLINKVNDYGSINSETDPTEPTPTITYSGYYFKDGKRKIDFILTWVEKEKELPSTILYRKKFESNLRKTGVELEEEVEETPTGKFHYIKIYVPWEIMCRYAEKLALRAPLQAHPNPSDDWSMKVLSFFHIHNVMYIDVPNKPADYYTCEFKQSKINKFLGSQNRSTYFTPTQRHQVVNEILETQLYGRRRKGEIGINRMLEDEIYDAAFPIHEGPYESTEKELAEPEKLNSRQILYEYWARYSRWYKYQPLDHIREYFGEKIGFYFAWMGLYTAWLLPASIIGILVFLYGVFTFNNNISAKEICDDNNTFVMCPLCDENIGCQYWELKDVCMFIKIAYLFDHPGTIFYSIFMSMWAVTFLEYWKRKNASLAHHWDVMDYEEEEERPRAQFAALCSIYQKNPVTGVLEPFFPKERRLPRIMTGIACILLMMTVVIIFIIAVIIYRVLIEIPMFQNPLLRNNAVTFANGTAAVVNLVLIMSLGRVYEIIALKLTEWEMHRTQSDFDNQLIIKVYLFQFVNFYSSIFYVAFFKGRFVGYPGHYHYFFGLRNEDCQNGGCLIELAMQLAVIMIGKQIISNIQEVLVPKLRTWFYRFSKGLEQQRRHSVGDQELVIYKEDTKLIPYDGLLEEYLEMVLQFGFITIFVAAFPLAPFFALLNNWMEIRLDAQKLVCETQRPVAERGKDIGVWFVILESTTIIACVSNAFLLAFTSEFLPKLYYDYKFKTMNGFVNHSLSWSPFNSTKQPCRYPGYRENDGTLKQYFWELLAIRFGFVIAFEHIVTGIGRLLDILIPDVPRGLYIKIKRESYLAKQALLDTDLVIMDHSEEEKA